MNRTSRFALHSFRRCLVAVLALLAPSPLLVAAQEPDEEEAAPEIVAEALFMCDALPPGGNDLNLSVGVSEGEPDPVTGKTALMMSPRAQLAVRLGDRAGFTVDAGVDTAGDVAFDTPGASLKLLLREPGVARTGFAASVDLFGSTHSLDEVEAGVGVGAIHPIGRAALRAAMSVATGVSAWTPHLHGGVSAALALGGRWRALAEVTADVADREVAFAAGPTMKVQLSDSVAFMAGAHFPLTRDGGVPQLAFQLTRTMW